MGQIASKIQHFYNIGNSGLGCFLIREGSKNTKDKYFPKVMQEKFQL